MTKFFDRQKDIVKILAKDLKNNDLIHFCGGFYIARKVNNDGEDVRADLYYKKDNTLAANKYYLGKTYTYLYLVGKKQKNHPLTSIFK